MTKGTGKLGGGTYSSEAVLQTLRQTQIAGRMGGATPYWAFTPKVKLIFYSHVNANVSSVSVSFILTNGWDKESLLVVEVTETSENPTGFIISFGGAHSFWLWYHKALWDRKRQQSTSPPFCGSIWTSGSECWLAVTTKDQAKFVENIIYFIHSLRRFFRWKFASIPVFALTLYLFAHSLNFWVIIHNHEHNFNGVLKCNYCLLVSVLDQTLYIFFKSWMVTHTPTISRNKTQPQYFVCLEKLTWIILSIIYCGLAASGYQL